MKKNETIALGAVIAAGVIGTLAAVLASKKEPLSWAEQARLFANGIIVEKEDNTKRNVVLGTIAGSLIGVASALVVAHQSGGATWLDDMIKPVKKEAKKVAIKAKKEVSKATKKAKKTIKKAHKQAKDLALDTINSFG